MPRPEPTSPNNPDPNAGLIFIFEKSFQKGLKAFSSDPKKTQLINAAVRTPLSPHRQACKLVSGNRIRKNSWRVHVTYRIRAIAQVEGNTWSWYFVATHEEYNSFVGK